MTRDDRLYAFIIAHTSSSRSRIRRFGIQKSSLKLFGLVLVLVFAGTVYGFYGLTQHIVHFQIERENRRLKAENERQRLELNQLNNRVEAVEDTSRKLAEKSGVVQYGPRPGAGGGPALPLDFESLARLEEKTQRLELELLEYEALLREKGYTPTAWPVEGKLESGFGGRKSPFGGGTYEFHSGQDIDAPHGAPVVSGASGKVTFAGWQNGYGQIVVLDHGGGLTTRYAHLSNIDVAIGQIVERSQFLGRVGSTGRSTGPHLHYEVRINDQSVNPLPYLVGTP